MTTLFNQKLEDDCVLSGLINDEYQRQNRSIELIASENFTSPTPYFRHKRGVLAHLFRKQLRNQLFQGESQFRLPK